MTEERLLAFAQAWTERNVTEVMHFFTEDCVYKPSLLEGEIHTYAGKFEVEGAVSRMIAFDDASSTQVKNITIDGNFGFWEWVYENHEGTLTLGCDVFEFREDKIVSKNAYRKIKI